MGCLQQRNRRCSSSCIVHLPLFWVFFTAIILEKSAGVVSAWEYYNGKPSNLTLEIIHEYLSKINKPAVMTVESPDGNIIDCVDIYKQPAFDNPLLKDHKLQLVPTEFPGEKRRTKEKEVKRDYNISSVVPHMWRPGCPKGTVPIMRTTVEDVLRAESIEHFELLGRKSPNTALAALNATMSPNDNINDPIHEYAVVNTKPGTALYGATAAINLWNPYTAQDEMSISQIWLAAGEYFTTSLNTIEAGWIVCPHVFGDRKTHLFVYWTADNYGRTGCYNLKCQGFVQISDQIIVGSSISTTSIKDGTQHEIVLQIYKDRDTGNWWLGFGEDGHKVGYWPSNLFTTLKDSATEAQWGGEVLDAKLDGKHTITEMGSNRFAEEGYRKASYFRQVFVLDSNYAKSLAVNPTFRVTNENCYSFQVLYSDGFFGPHFFYGGPGYNVNCP